MRHWFEKEGEMAHRFEWSEEENRCFGCGDNPWGLGLKFELQKDGWVAAETSLHPNFQGFRKWTHGGIVATLIDEALVWAAMLQEGVIGPTYQVSFRIKRPVPLEEKILIRAKVLECRHKICSVRAEIADSQGQVLAIGEGRLKVMETAKSRKGEPGNNK